MTTKNFFNTSRLFVIFIIMLGGASCTANTSPDKQEVYVHEITAKSYTAANRFEGLADYEQLMWKTLDQAHAKLISDYRVASLEYKTPSLDGAPLIVSGIIAYPTNSKFRGTILVPMSTIFANYECGTARMNMLYTYFAQLGYVVISPDYIGFGASKALPHPYLHRELTGTTCADMVLAAREYMAKIGKPINDTIAIAGYSQGAAAAISTQYIIERQYNSEIPISAVYAGSGPHDLKATFDDYAHTKTTGYPCSVPNVVLGLNYGDNLTLNIEKIFTGKLLENYTEWILSKKNNASEINTLLGTNDLTQFMHPDMFTNTLNSELDKLTASCVKNSNITNFVPKAPIKFYYSQEDTFVPAFNTLNAYNKYKAAGSDVSIKVIAGEHLIAGAEFLFIIAQLLDN